VTVQNQTSSWSFCANGFTPWLAWRWKPALAIGAGIGRAARQMPASGLWTARQGLEAPSKPAGFPDALAMLLEEDRYYVEERAAIMEFDGGLERDAAERAAFSLYWRAKHREN
jgi:hypothetical protein